jgi:hypothetical protein
MKNNRLTKINYNFWDNINYYFNCFKKQKIPEQNYNEKEADEKEADEKDDLLGVQSIIMYNRY